jgi:excisionase family DNA binding protein
VPEFLTLQEVADIVRAAPNTVWTWVKRGQLPATRAGKLWRVSKEDLSAFLHRPIMPEQAPEGRR